MIAIWSFDKTRFFITFKNHLGICRNIVQFQISPKSWNRWKDTRFIKDKVLRKVFSKQFYFIRYRRQHLRDIEWRRYSRFTFVENIIGNSPKVPRAKFLGSKGLFCFISIRKFGNLKNPFATITSLSELFLWFRRFILLIQTKKTVSINHGSSTSSWKPWRWVRLHPIFTMRDMYISSNLNPLTKFTSSSRSTKFKDILPSNIS